MKDEFLSFPSICSRSNYDKFDYFSQKSVVLVLGDTVLFDKYGVGPPNFDLYKGLIRGYVAFGTYVYVVLVPTYILRGIMGLLTSILLLYGDIRGKYGAFSPVRVAPI